MGEWTQLTGVYDESDRQVRLYVNSALVAATPIAPDVHLMDLQGPLVLGRAKLDGAPARFFMGMIDHVVVYNWVRTDKEIQADSRIPPQPPTSIDAGQFSRWISNAAVPH